MAKRIPAPWLKFYGKRKKTIKYPESSLYDDIKRAAEKYPDNTALNYFGNKINHSTFLTAVDRAAQSLVSLGINKGDAVSLCSPNIPEAVIALYAINKIGAIANIFHPLSAPNEIRDNLNLAESRLFLAFDGAWPNIKPILDQTKVEQAVILSPADSLPLSTYLGYKLLNVKEMRRQLREILKRNKTTISWDDFMARGRMVVGDVYEKMSSDDIAVILYSGGTTGSSKGIALSNMPFTSMALQLNDFIKSVTPINGKMMLAVMPIFHGFGLGVGIHTALANGAGSVLYPRFDVKKFDKILSDGKPNFLIGVPALYEAMLNNKKIRKMDLSFIEAAFSGGDTVTKTLRHSVNDLFHDRGSKSRLLEGYGLTESLSVVSINPANKEKDGSIGIPLSDCFFKVVEPSTYITKPYGQSGEIVVTGPLLMNGYINNEKETNITLQRHPDGHIWLHTGDMGYMDKDGYTYFTDRIKRMIVSAGYNIYPSEVEKVIMQVPEVLLATVVGIPDKYRGQIAAAFIVLKSDHRPSDEIKETIMQACYDSLAKYKWPRKIEFRDSLPKTKIGKVDYKELAKTHKSSEK